MKEIRYSVHGFDDWKSGTVNFTNDIGIDVSDKDGTFFIPWTSILMISYIKGK
ncbi:MAG: hypothetical protein U9R50_10110 [Campylobacterota bacterium]|nr:hypothetical protein [Campylobacterota bacterium]